MTVMLATFMEVLDTSVANVALPHIAGNLSATGRIHLGADLLPGFQRHHSAHGRLVFHAVRAQALLHDLRGVFTVSSFLCGLAPTLGLLIVFRVMQGLGGGALQPVSQAILVESFPREKQGMAMAVFGMGVVVAPVIGPTLGGWITDNYSWRWIFFINIPMGILALLLTAALVFDPPYLVRKSLGKRRPQDRLHGLRPAGLGLGSLEVVLDEGQREDWFSSPLHRDVRRDHGRQSGRRVVWGVAAEAAGDRFPRAQGAQFHAGHAVHAGAGLRALRQHRAAAAVPADAARVHRHAQRAGAFAGRHRGDCFLPIVGLCCAGSRRAGW
jgi:hypothetical protein